MRGDRFQTSNAAPMFPRRSVSPRWLEGRYNFNTPPTVGRELSDDEIRKAGDAGLRAIEPLIQARAKLLREWTPTAPLTRDQMSRVMEQALATARGIEKNLVDMIAKVPSHWEGYLKNELGPLRAALDESPKFGTLIAATQPGASVLVPGFRDWIDHLLTRSENGVMVVAAVSENLPDWLRMRALLSALHAAALGVIEGIVMAAKGVGALPALLPKVGIVAAIAGGVVVLGAIAFSASGRSR